MAETVVCSGARDDERVVAHQVLALRKAAATVSAKSAPRDVKRQPPVASFRRPFRDNVLAAATHAGRRCGVWEA